MAYINCTGRIRPHDCLHVTEKKETRHVTIMSMNGLSDTLQKRFRGKKVLIVGLGLQGGGVGMARFFSNLGAYVKVTDRKNGDELSESVQKLASYKNISYSFGVHSTADFISSDYIFIGPSVRWDMPQIQEAQRKGIPIEMEASFFASVCPACVIGVTGTRGKSTVATMVFSLLRKTGKRAFLAGNVAGSSTVEILKYVEKDDYVVLELSSWQLSGFHRKRISPHISVFTNVYPDHLNYYASMDEYLFDKKAVYLYQTQSDYLIAHEDLKKIIENDYPKSTVMYFKSSDYTGKLPYLRGMHNRDNASSVLKIAEVLGIKKTTAEETLFEFRGLPGRCEVMKKKDNVFFVNDTTSTTPVATIKAIDSFNGETIVLILGGNSKNLPVVELLDKLDQVEKIILLKGNFTEQVFASMDHLGQEKVVETFDSLEKAVDAAYGAAKELAKEKKSVYILFSPGATSFGMFKNEFHRGDEFVRIVETVTQHD